MRYLNMFIVSIIVSSLNGNSRAERSRSSRPEPVLKEVVERRSSQNSRSVSPTHEASGLSSPQLSINFPSCLLTRPSAPTFSFYCGVHPTSLGPGVLALQAQL